MTGSIKEESWHTEAPGLTDSGTLPSLSLKGQVEAAELPEPGENLQPWNGSSQAGFMAHSEYSHFQKHEGEDKYLASFSFHTYISFQYSPLAKLKWKPEIKGRYGNFSVGIS